MVIVLECISDARSGNRLIEIAIGFDRARIGGILGLQDIDDGGDDVAKNLFMALQGLDTR